VSAVRAAAFSLASGVLCALTFPPSSLWPLAFVALAPYFHVARTVSPKAAVLVSLAFAAGYFGIGLFWVSSLSLLGLALLTIVLSGFIVVATFSLRLAARSRWVPYWLGAPAIWASVEYLRTILLTGFPWILLGHSQHPFLALSQIADLGGVYAISFVLALFAAAVAEVARERARASWLRLAAASAALLSAVAYGLVRMGTIERRDGPVVSGVQANLSPYAKHRGDAKDNLAVHARLSEQAVGAHPETDLVVWSETMFPWSLDENLADHATRLLILEGQARQLGRPLLVGAVVVEKGDEDQRSFSRREHNSALYVSATGEVVGRYDKMHLVPVGEFIPLRRYLPMRASIEAAIEAMLLYFPNLSPGEEPVVFALSTPRGGFRFGTLICYESIFPEPSREMVRRGADFLVNLSNDGWYGKTAELDQMVAMSAFRAIENRVPLFRVTNTGISAAYDPLGRVVGVIEVGGERKEVAGTLTAILALSGGPTVYRAIGDVFVQLLVGFSALAIADGWRRQKQA
jgi:apolipoprotein N-acyltransferase